jgi:hypothetical protein
MSLNRAYTTLQNEAVYALKSKHPTLALISSSVDAAVYSFTK